jgi:hypothetical protein
MSERAWSFDPPSESLSSLGAKPPRAGDHEISDVIERATRVQDGLALLRCAPLETAAILLGVAPPAIERARASLRSPGALENATALLASAAASWRAAAAPPPRPPAPRDPEQLIDAARKRADGLSLLLSAAPEAAAIAFGVHPDLILGAREFAARRADPRRS